MRVCVCVRRVCGVACACAVRVNAVPHSCARRLKACALGKTPPTPTSLFSAASTGRTLHSNPHIQSPQTPPYNFPTTTPHPLYILKWRYRSYCLNALMYLLPLFLVEKRICRIKIQSACKLLTSKPFHQCSLLGGFFFCKFGVHGQANWCIFRSLEHSNQIASLL